MSADREEVVVDTHRAGSCQLRKQLTDHSFLFGTRRAEVRGLSLHGGVRKRAHVQLSVQCQRDDIKRFEIRWHHVLGQFAREFGPQRRCVRHLLAGLRHQVSYKPLVAIDCFCDNGHLGQAAEGTEQCLFDFAQFDTKAADLDLAIGTAHVDHHAVGTAHDQIAGAVHPCTRCAERAGNKAFGCQARTSEIAPCHTCTRHIELTDSASRNERKTAVEQVALNVRDRLSDGNRPGIRCAIE